MHNDALGRPLYAGDPVAYSYGKYGDLREGVAEAFTPVYIRIRRPDGGFEMKTPSKVVKVD